ncbi:MAG TPA: DNA repair protein RadA [Pseudobdellovibrionaceae bacterium]|mgnify:CR=1 FL=1|nr:DNA repair protein RadA [Pseudobdellovibrionaceae bacterium]
MGKSKTKSKTIFTCQNCGAQRSRWEGKCSDCGSWNSFVEETFNATPQTRGWLTEKEEKTAKKHQNLDERIEATKMERFSTQIEELDRVLGGGLAKGSLTLLGGAPGIGKSTLLLQMAGGLAAENHQVLYVSGEESIEQTGSRAQRLGIRSSKITVSSLNNLLEIIELSKSLHPEILVIDSIQTVFHPDLEASPGTVSQVRECAGHLMGLAKQKGISILLVGHITKDGSIAGPKVLEHMVDCVLSFEGDSSYNYRMLRTLKNRFGSVLELGIFKMSDMGLTEVTNPSEFFLEERGKQLIGSVVFASMEGSRPLLCEIQALTVFSPLPSPRRTAVGIDYNRLHMLTAVLERHLEMKLSNADIYINVVGGLKLVEPASDLAIAAAIISTQSNRVISAKSCFFGEVGLTGEIRNVSFADLRIKEALKLGFDHFVVPQSCQKILNLNQMGKDIKISFVKTIQDLVKWI